MNDAYLAAFGALLWCLPHSLLVNAWKDRPWGRLAYNVIATVTLVVLFAWLRGLDGEVLGQWSGPWQGPRLVMLVMGLALGWLGAKGHDNGSFLGLRQLRHGIDTSPPVLSRTGILGHLRHPWYMAGLLILPVWPTTFTTVNVAWRAVFMLYLVVGAHLEDRRLEDVFGEEFRRYRREVPGFLPRKQPTDRP